LQNSNIKNITVTLRKADKNSAKEDALGLVEKIMELGKKGKDLGSEKAKGD